MNEKQKNQFSGTGEKNNRIKVAQPDQRNEQTITGIITSRIENRNKNGESYHYAFFKSPNLVDPEAEFPVIFKEQRGYYKPTITKGNQVQLTGTWSPGEDRPSLTCSDFKIINPAEPIKEPNHKLNLYQKLHLIQSQTGKITKAEENKFGKYKYFTEQQALNILKPLLAEQKLTLTFSDIYEPATNWGNQCGLEKSKYEKEWTISYLKRAILTNSENPTEQLTFHFWAIGSNSDPAKAKGCAETYAIKYFLTKFFLIPTTDELDPDVTKPTEHLNRLANGRKETPEQIQARHQAKDQQREAELKAKYGLDWKLSNEYKNWKGNL